MIKESFSLLLTFLSVKMASRTPVGNPVTSYAIKRKRLEYPTLQECSNGPTCRAWGKHREAYQPIEDFSRLRTSDGITSNATCNTCRRLPAVPVGKRRRRAPTARTVRAKSALLRIGPTECPSCNIIRPAKSFIDLRTGIASNKRCRFCCGTTNDLDDFIVSDDEMD